VVIILPCSGKSTGSSQPADLRRIAVDTQHWLTQVFQAILIVDPVVAGSSPVTLAKQ
jgi:hypothetical protein